MTAQLYGKHLADEIVQMAVRSVGIGMMAALALIILQIPIREAAFFFIHPTEEIKRLATTYFHICIWELPLPWASMDSQDGISGCKTHAFQ